MLWIERRGQVLIALARRRRLAQFRRRRSRLRSWWASTGLPPNARASTLRRARHRFIDELRRSRSR